MIITGANILVASFLVAILVPGLPLLVLSAIVVGGFIVLMAGNVLSIILSLSKKTITRCAICGLEFTGRTFPIWKNVHYQSVHHDYSSWLKRSTRNLFLVVLPSIVILTSSLFLWLRYGGAYSYLAGLAVLSWIVFGVSWPAYYRRQVRRFRRGWEDKHQP